MKRWGGIDPGLSGAFCVLTELSDGSLDHSFIPFPVIQNEINFQELGKIFSVLTDVKFVLEKVGVMPKQGISSGFKFGRIFGTLQAGLHFFRIEHIEATPQRWQKEFHEGLSKELHPKARSLIAVQRLFPYINLLATERSRKPHAGFVDALLMAEYSRRHFRI